jgi:hypothetical protein
VIDFHSFLPDEITIAPKHPLAQNFELLIPEANSASSEEIRQIQQSLSGAALEEPRLSGIVKRIIPLDADTFWEYWWCVPVASCYRKM